MQFLKYKKPITLGILFFLPVMFLLFLYPSTHNYNPLDIVGGSVEEIDDFRTENTIGVKLEDHITVMSFLGTEPNSNAIAALNLKELIYDKFRGFKRFQVVVVVPESSENAIIELKKELFQYEALNYWHFIYGNKEDIDGLYNSLKAKKGLDNRLATDEVFIIDKDRSQRGRLDDRTDNEKERDAKIYGLPSYNCLEVAEIKNKMSEDMRILFTEYRQKRKGHFDSSIRRAQDIANEEK